MEIRTLITQVLMPRIRQLEEEIASLRKHTWPYIQAMKEQNQLDDIQAKRDFARHLDDTTLLELIRLKAQLKCTGRTISSNEIVFSETGSATIF